jgi:hypothetical protein
MKITNPRTGEALHKSEWARKLGLHRAALDYRIKKWGLDKALNTPYGEVDARMLTLPSTGETLPVAAWAKRLGMRPGSLTARIDKFNWDLERALTEPRGSFPEPRILTHPVTKESMPLAQWSIKLDKADWTIRKQIGMGLPMEVVLSNEQEEREMLDKLLTHPQTGESMSVTEWADELGLSPWQLIARLDNPDWTLEDALSLPFQGEKAPSK